MTRIEQETKPLMCGVDWVSLTLQAERGDYVSWCRDALDWTMEGVGGGNKGRAQSLQGYSGVMAGSRFFGRRDFDAMLRVSGADAWAALYGFWRPDCGVSRLDLQTTAYVGRDNTGFHIKRAYARAKEDIDTGAIASKLTSLMMNNTRGLTCYIGSKKSLVYIRIYDKGAESRNPDLDGFVRYEVEYHNEASKAVAKGLMQQNGRMVGRRVVDTVAYELSKRRVEVPFAYDGGQEVVIVTEKKETDAERKLQWLRAQVRPTVEWLASIGMLSEVIESLGMGKWEWSEIERGLTGDTE